MSDMSMGRRRFMVGCAAGTLVSTLAPARLAAAPSETPAFEDPLLPYDHEALAPHLSAKTIKFHFDGHHKTYYSILTQYVNAHAEYAGLGLEEIIRRAHGKIGVHESVFQNAVLLYNHNAYWKSLNAAGGVIPRGVLRRKIEESIGGPVKLKHEIKEKGMALGSGWVWLVAQGEEVLVTRTDYHDSPLVKKQVPLLAIDVWEHAYYLDYYSDREKYLDVVWDNLINWEYAQGQFDAALAK